MSTHLVFVHALSPIHCGTGQAVSGIDLPVAREKPTGIPLIPGSSIKGVLRAQPGGHEPSQERRQAKPVHIRAFGPDTENASEHAGGVQFADAHLLFMPVRSVRGTVAWVTAPYMLRRLARDVRETELKWNVPRFDAMKEGEALVTGDRLIVKVANKDRVVFEDFDFDAKKTPELANLAKNVGQKVFGDAPDDVQHFVDRVCVVHDDVMRVLCRVGMEVVARNRIDDDNKTVAKGALWTEEALPVESILSGLVVVTPVGGDKPADLLGHVRKLCTHPFQIGGKATVGRGLCRMEVL